MPAAPRSAFSRVRFYTAFTLTELLVVIALIAILLALIFPIVGKLMRAGKDVACTNNLKQLGAGYHAYAADNGGSVLTDGGAPHEWTRVIQPYVGQTPFTSVLLEVFTCPVAPVKKEADKLWWKPDYGANVHGAVFGRVNEDASLGLSLAATAAPKMAAQERPAEVIVFLDWIPNWRFARTFEFAQANDPARDKERVYRHSGRVNAVFMDGHIDTISYPLGSNWKSPPWQTLE